MRTLLVYLGPLLNQSLSAAIAVISGSFLLHSFSRGVRNRVARAFSTLLFFVTLTYIGDLGVSYSDDLTAAETWLRFQWIGIAFAPAAYVHLSDAILSMTGLPSRGRRRRLVHFLYVAAGLFLAAVIWTDWLVRDPRPDPAPHFQAGQLFWGFLAYFLGAVFLSMWFVLRARRRALTPTTRRRMAYLLIPYTAPAWAVFPFLLIAGPSEMVSSLVFYAILIVVDIVLAVMLTFMAYPLAFFGSLVPDRVVKTQMLQFFLRGPVVALAALAVIVWVPPAGGVLGLPSDQVTPFLTVVVILFLQLFITLIRPVLERYLVYAGDWTEVKQIQELETRLITSADFQQLFESILAATCDYLRTETAFVASLTGRGARLEHAIGLRDEISADLEDAPEFAAVGLNGELPQPAMVGPGGQIFTWHDFWLIPLHFQQKPQSADDEPRLVGLLGVSVPESGALDGDQWHILMALATRAAEVLEDRRLQTEVFGMLQGLLPEIEAMQVLRGAARYEGVTALTAPREDLPGREDFTRNVKDALSHYWGGPKLTNTSLMHLEVVRQALEENDDNPQKAMRTVLQRAVESLRPEGQRSMTTTEWILYNILEMRFIQGRKVRDVAMRLAMSESDLYRKQRVAIEAVAGIIADMERAAQEADASPQPST